MGKRKQHKVEDIVWSYTKDDWMDWISDILKYEVAYPVYVINQESDNVLMDMPEWLVENKTETTEYQKALIWHIKNRVDLKSGKITNINYLERLFESLGSITWETFLDEEYFIDILTSEKFDSTRTSRDSLKSELLSILSNQNISLEKLKKIENYAIRMLSRKIQDEFFWIGYISIKVRNYPNSLALQLEALSLVISLLSKKDLTDDRILVAIVDTIKEIHFRYAQKSEFISVSQIWRKNEDKKETNLVREKILKAIDNHYFEYIEKSIY